MSYLWIKENDSKTFKSFLCGNEIEVGLYLNQNYDVFRPGSMVEIFYGDESSDTYRAEVRKQQRSAIASNTGKSFMTLSLVKVR